MKKVRSVRKAINSNIRGNNNSERKVPTKPRSMHHLQVKSKQTRCLNVFSGLITEETSVEINYSRKKVMTNVRSNFKQTHSRTHTRSGRLNLPHTYDSDMDKITVVDLDNDVEIIVPDEIAAGETNHMKFNTENKNNHISAKPIEPDVEIIEPIDSNVVIIKVYTEKPDVEIIDLVDIPSNLVIIKVNTKNYSHTNYVPPANNNMEFMRSVILLVDTIFNDSVPEYVRLHVLEPDNDETNDENIDILENHINANYTENSDIHNIHPLESDIHTEPVNAENKINSPVNNVHKSKKVPKAKLPRNKRRQLRCANLLYAKNSKKYQKRLDNDTLNFLQTKPLPYDPVAVMGDVYCAIAPAENYIKNRC